MHPPGRLLRLSEDLSHIETFATDRLIKELNRLTLKSIDIATNTNSPIETALEQIFKPIATGTDDRFFAQLVHHLAIALGVRYAQIAEFHTASRCLQTLAFWASDRHQTFADTDLAHSLCSNLAGQIPFYAQEVQRQFSQEPLFLRRPIASNWRYRILNSKSEVIGVLAMMDDQPMLRSTDVEAIASLLAEQVGVEMERLWTEVAVQEEHHQLVSLIDSLPGIVFISNADAGWSMRYLSRGCLALTGYTSEELIGAQLVTYNDIVHPDDLPKALAVIAQAIEHQQPYVVEYRIHTKAGQEKWLWEKGQGVFDASQKVVGIEGFISDITNQKHTQTALQQKEKFLRLILDNIPQYIFWKDIHSTYLGGNSTWAKAAGLNSPEEAYGKRDDDFPWGVDKAELFRAQDRKIVATGEPIQVIETWVHADGVSTQISVTKLPIPDANGNTMGILGTIEDITEQLRFSSQLRQQSEGDRLLKDISLQIRQSLNLEDTLNTTVVEIQQFLQADRVLVYRLDAEWKGILVAAATDPAWAIDPTADPHYTWLNVTEFQSYIETSPLELAYQQGNIWVVDDVTQQGFCLEHLAFLKLLDVKAKLIIPLLQGDALWGLLAVHQCQTPRQWQPFEIDLLQQMAVQVAIAIQQAQLFHQVQQQAQREQLLNRISRSVSSSLDPEHILQEIVKLTGECFQVDRVLIFTIDERIRAVNEWRAGEQVPSLQGEVLSIADWTDLLDPDSDFLNHRAFHAPDFSRLPANPSRLIQCQQGKTLSVLCAPIVVREQLFGGLALHTIRARRVFAQEEVHLLERIADQMAIALCNAQNYEHLEQLVRARTQELEAEKLVSEAASRAKSEFLAVMSHELRTPLNAILGLSELLKQEIFGELNPKQRDYISCIHSSGEHLLALISDILDLSKVEAGKEELLLAPVVVPDLCTYCLSLVQEKALEAGLKLSYAIDPQAEICVADERRLRQMILNLLSNAIKFTPAGEVSLVVQIQAEQISFTVIDTGIGIAPEQLSTLFQPVPQLDSQLNRRYEGTGLGLVLTQRLAQLHGGNVTVTSTLGEGSRFTIGLPYLSDQVHACYPQLFLEPRSPDPLTPPLLKPDLMETAQFVMQPFSALPFSSEQFTVTVPETRKHILIVEDDESSAVLIQDYLEVLGYRVMRLPNGKDFVEHLQRFQPHLILMDVQLGDQVTGLELLIALRQQPNWCSLPVVMVTAMAMRGDRERCLAAGATDYLSKPIGLIQLESLLLRCL